MSLMTSFDVVLWRVAGGVDVDERGVEDDRALAREIVFDGLHAAFVARNDGR